MSLRFNNRNKQLHEKKNLWDVAKSVLRGKFRVIKSTSGNKKNLKISNLTPKGKRRTNKTPEEEAEEKRS